MADSSFSQSSSQSTSEPFAPDYITQAGNTANELIGSAKTSAAAQQKRLQDYINHLYQVRDMARLAARGAGARGASGMQNPLSVYKSLNQLSDQAGIPIDAEIKKAIMGSNDIENTMNSLISQAGQLQGHLGSIMKSQATSQSTQQSGGGGGGGGGGFKSQPGGQEGGRFTDMHGNQYHVNPDGSRTLMKIGDKSPFNEEYQKFAQGEQAKADQAKEDASSNPPWLTDYSGQKTGQTDGAPQSEGYNSPLWAGQSPNLGGNQTFDMNSFTPNMPNEGLSWNQTSPTSGGGFNTDLFTAWNQGVDALPGANNFGLTSFDFGSMGNPEPQGVGQFTNNDFSNYGAGLIEPLFNYGDTESSSGESGWGF